MYSREEETAAYKFSPQIHHQTKKSRHSKVMLQQRKITRNLNNDFIGKNLDVLIESKNNNIFIGRTQYDAPEVDGVVFINKKDLDIGQLYKAKIIDAWDYDLVAT